MNSVMATHISITQPIMILHSIILILIIINHLSPDLTNFHLYNLLGKDKAYDKLCYDGIFHQAVLLMIETHM